MVLMICNINFEVIEGYDEGKTVYYGLLLQYAVFQRHQNAPSFTHFDPFFLIQKKKLSCWEKIKACFKPVWQVS